MAMNIFNFYVFLYAWRCYIVHTVKFLYTLCCYASLSWGVCQGVRSHAVLLDFSTGGGGGGYASTCTPTVESLLSYVQNNFCQVRIMINELSYPRRKLHNFVPISNVVVKFLQSELLNMLYMNFRSFIAKKDGRYRGLNTDGY
jgi:hypothetical protein